MISGEVVLLIIITLINLALWIVFFLRLRRTFSPQALLTDIKNEVDKLLIEINKTALDDVTLMEERAKSLRSLIEEADRRLLLMQGQEAGKIREKEVLDRLSTRTEIKPKQKAAQMYQKMSQVSDEGDHSQAVQLSIDFDSYKVDSKESDGGNQVDMPTIVHVEDSPLPQVSFKEKVLQMVENGLSSEHIANKLGKSISEVQLIIDLHYSQ